MANNNEWITNVLLAGGKRSDESDVGFSLNPAKTFRSISRAVKTVGRKAGNTVRGVGRVAKGIPFFGPKLIAPALGEVNVAGRVVGRLSTDIGRKLSKVPVIGPGLHAVYAIGPGGVVDAAAGVAAGKRIDLVAYDALKNRIKAYQDVAPYVQTVISFVPGVGQGVSGAIGAANALSKGQPITDALIAATKDALPGGPLAAAAFDVAVAGIQGKPIEAIAINALPLPSDQKDLLIRGVAAAKDIANGKNVADSVYNQAKDKLPPEAQKALQIGIALGHGQTLQKIAKEQVVNTVPQLSALGTHQVSVNPVYKAGAEVVKHNTDMLRGFHVGLGFLQHKVNPTALLSLKANMTPAQKKGFDIAASAHVGHTALPLPTTIPAAQRFGYYVTQGMHGNKPKFNKAIMETIVKHPDVKKGAIAAALEIKSKRKTIQAHPSFWVAVKHFLGFA